MEPYYYEPEPPERFYCTTDLPTIPIDPEKLSKNVTNRLSELNGGIVAEKTNDMVEEMCKVFNYCIELNKTSNKAETKTLILSPKTGSAKSLTAKEYVSLLPSDYKTLIVVLRVDDAIEYCEDINLWSSNSTKAKCTYAITPSNPQSEYWVDKSGIDYYECIVMTHAMYKRLCLDFKYTQRDLVIVDERINMTQKFEVDEPKLVALINTLEGLNGYCQNMPISYSKTIDALQKLNTIFHEFSEQAKSSKVDTLFVEHIKVSRSFIFPIKTDYDKHQLLKKEIKTCSLFSEQSTVEVTTRTSIELPKYDEYKFDVMLDLLSQHQRYLLKHATPLVNNSRANTTDIMLTIRELVESISILNENSFFYHLSSSVGKLVNYKKIPRSFGSNILLDATSEVNKYYDDLVYHDSSYIHYAVTDPRNYKNLRINISIGKNQGKTSVYEGLSSQELSSLVNDYLGIASSILGSNDKLLIVTFKELKEHLESSNAAQNIVFTHWGNHIGKNNWSDCNKVMIIGWNYIPKIEHRLSMSTAVQTPNSAFDEYCTESNNEYNATRLADDLVQASMRGSARKVSDSSGDCAPSEIFLFSPRYHNGLKVIDYYLTQFKDATVNRSWQPEFSTSHSASMRKTDEDKVIEYLQANLHSNAPLECKVCRTSLSISESSFSKVLKKVKILAFMGAEKIKVETQSKKKYFVKD